MIKKISAILLALVLCLSVVVFPASAIGFDSDYALEDGKQIAFKVETDKDSYSAGDTVTVYFDLYGDPDVEIGNLNLTFSFNSAQFSKTTNTVKNVKNSVVRSDLADSWFKAASVAYFTTTNTNAFNAAATAEEKAAYDLHIKINNTRFTAGSGEGSHDNSEDNTRGLPVSEINEEEGYFISFQLVLADTYVTGTPIQIGIAPTTMTMKNPSTNANAFTTYIQALETPGESNSAPMLDASVYNMDEATALVVPAAKATVTYVDGLGNTLQTSKVDIGSATPSCAAPTRAGYTFAGWTPAVADTVTGDVTYTATWKIIPLTVSHWKDQIRFDKKGNGTYNGTFDYRMLATIDNFDEVIGTDYDKVTDVGFIFNKGAAIDEATAKAQVENGVVGGTYSYVRDVYVSTAYQGETYVISCLVNNIADADKTTVLSSMAYVEYVVDGVTYYAYSAVKTSNFEGLYNTYYSKEFGA